MFHLDSDCCVNILLLITSNYTDTSHCPAIGHHTLTPPGTVLLLVWINHNYYPLKIVLRRFKNSFKINWEQSREWVYSICIFFVWIEIPMCDYYVWFKLDYLTEDY